MKNVILLHGLATKEEYYDSSQPSNSNSHWFPWLQKQLMVHDIKADTPEVPDTYKMQWDTWVREVERFDIGPETVLIGHSMGGGFWIRYLTEHPELRVAKAVLVAPWLNLEHEEDSNFFDFELNPDIINQMEQLTIFASDNDHQEVQNSVNFLKEKIPGAKLSTFHNYGHFCYSDMKTTEFPELLEEILS